MRILIPDFWLMHCAKNAFHEEGIRHRICNTCGRPGSKYEQKTIGEKAIKVQFMCENCMSEDEVFGGRCHS